MKNKIKNILKQQGYTPIFISIQNTIKDLKKAGYYKSEIKDTIIEFYGNIDNKIDNEIFKLIKQKVGKNDFLYIYNIINIWTFYNK